MSKIGNYVLEMEEKGELVYDDIKLEYVTPLVYGLRTEIGYLEWQIQSLQDDLILKTKELEDEMQML